MIILAEEGFAEIEVKKSKFLSYAVHVDYFESKLNLLKQEHPKARHIVWAYKKTDEYGNVDLKSTDDGEPKGTAGKPTLNVLSYSGIDNVAIFTVRYFGGILLGTGGLVKAYSDAANLALKNCKVIDTAEVYKATIVVPFSKTQHIFYLIEKFALTVVKQDYVPDGVVLEILGKEQLVKEVKSACEACH
ncbi:YigZ family protein [Deferribacteraceae bacterium V6Fe1]|uniref:YigZ family protein n=1 Tax=Deferrivibrio essentukiensis TaxID=2880922 RepID=UPI001F60B85B|nr:YigZ family protein [Deferrivibrio essentukiensis]MCB4203799.1 YigZ family protein [Deferrivibrio essentukiensis]UOD33718.1 YigZ family protein [Deferribacteraceae bacterium V6Fe1]